MLWLIQGLSTPCFWLPPCRSLRAKQTPPLSMGNLMVTSRTRLSRHPDSDPFSNGVQKRATQGPLFDKMHFAAFLPLLAVTASALPASNASDYFTEVSQALINANLTTLGNVIKVVQSSGERGSALVNALFSEGNFTVYAPPDSVRCHNGTL
jgi:uncharacterized surface protein with fasciclin (FAS1) repeats